MSKSMKASDQLQKTFGGYMSVDRIEALKFNWQKIKSLTLPRTLPKKPENPSGKPHGS